MRPSLRAFCSGFCLQMLARVGAQVFVGAFVDFGAVSGLFSFFRSSRSSSVFRLLVPSSASDQLMFGLKGRVGELYVGEETRSGNNVGEESLLRQQCQTCSGNNVKLAPVTMSNLLR